MSTKSTGIGEAIGIVVLGTVLALGFSLYGAWVATILWAWFFEPAGYAPLSMSVAVGALLIYRLFAAKTKVDKGEDPWESMGRAVGHALFVPTIFLASGWALSAIV